MITLRPADESDADALASLRLAWAAERGVASDATFADRFTSWLTSESDRRIFWLASVDDVAVGMVNLLIFRRMPYPEAVPLPGAWGYLSNLFVRPEHRGSGIGGRLVQACTSYADDQALARVVLSPSPASVPLYLRAGFGAATGLMVRER